MPCDGIGWQKYDWPVIYDVSNYNAGLKYSTFIASDNPYTEIENKDLSDGSSCIVVKNRSEMHLFHFWLIIIRRCMSWITVIGQEVSVNLHRTRK